jgi:hypothetical protein
MQCLCREGANDPHYTKQCYRYEDSLGGRPIKLSLKIVFNISAPEDGSLTVNTSIGHCFHKLSSY